MATPKRTVSGVALARVFKTGGSQAVRLPQEFRFDTDKVVIRREGRNVILSPPFKDWDDFLENAQPFTDDFLEIMKGQRGALPPLEEREPFD